MATGGPSSRFVRLLGDGDGGNTRFGPALVLFGLLSVVAGVGLFALTEAFRFDPVEFRTYRRVAAGAAAFGLPAFLLGAIIAAGGERPELRVALVGGLLSVVAAVPLLAVYAGWWGPLPSPAYVVALAVYALGVALGAVGTVGAVLLGPDADDREGRTGSGTAAGPGTEGEGDADSGFIWGEPPEE